MLQVFTKYTAAMIDHWLLNKTKSVYPLDWIRGKAVQVLPWSTSTIVQELSTLQYTWLIIARFYQRTGNPSHVGADVADKPWPGWQAITRLTQATNEKNSALQTVSRPAKAWEPFRRVCDPYICQHLLSTALRVKRARMVHRVHFPVRNGSWNLKRKMSWNPRQA